MMSMWYKMFTMYFSFPSEDEGSEVDSEMDDELEDPGEPPFKREKIDLNQTLQGVCVASSLNSTIQPDPLIPLHADQIITSVASARHCNTAESTYTAV